MTYMYLASFLWPTGTEPLCLGKNKKRTMMRALEIARREHGTGLVYRPSAMCSAKIQRDDIELLKLEIVP